MQKCPDEIHFTHTEVLGAQQFIPQSMKSAVKLHTCSPFLRCESCSAAKTLQLTQSVVFEGASKDAQSPRFTLLLLLLAY